MSKITKTLIFSFLIISVNILRAQNNAANQQIVGMLESFYSEYITLVSDGVSPENDRQLDSLKRKYITAQCLARIKKQHLDYDPIIAAQDANSDCLSSLSVNRDSQKDNIYIVSWINSYDKSRTVIKLVVVKQKGLYKIDLIKK